MIYCGTCKWFISGTSKKGDICNHISNLQDSYRAPKDETIDKPSKINKNNDCTNYEEDINP